MQFWPAWRCFQNELYTPLILTGWKMHCFSSKPYLGVTLTLFQQVGKWWDAVWQHIPCTKAQEAEIQVSYLRLGSRPSASMGAGLQWHGSGLLYQHLLLNCYWLWCHLPVWPLPLEDYPIHCQSQCVSTILLQCGCKETSCRWNWRTTRAYMCPEMASQWHRGPWLSLEVACVAGWVLPLPGLGVRFWRALWGGHAEALLPRGPSAL